MDKGSPDGRGALGGAQVVRSESAPTNTEDLALQFSALARQLEQQADAQTTLDAIVHAAAGTIPGADDASVSVVHIRREVRTRASTSDRARAIDQAQYDAGQGPCLDTLFEQVTVRVPHLSSEQRWPDFTERAAGLGVRSMLSVRLFIRGDDLGALNMMSAGEDAFDAESEHVAILFASHATVAIAGAQRRDELQIALSSRDLIGQAKGILMERYKLTPDQAFRLLVIGSQRTNRKLRDIAEELATTGVLAVDGH